MLEPASTPVSAGEHALPLEVRTDRPLEAIDARSWDALAGAQPFVSHAFLSALHATGCASLRTGWDPCYITAWRGNALAGAMPLYAKTHSYGEYVFDWGWAEAYRRHGRRYYPKLLSAVPFTPVPGPRLLTADATVRKALLDAALARMHGGGFSSLHILLQPPEDSLAGEKLGMTLREGVQFHWTNRDYLDFADFLAALTQEKRKKIKQERRRVAASGVTFERIPGASLTAADWAFFYHCYESTYRAHRSTPYLTPEFFHRIGSAIADHLLLVIGSRQGRRLCAALDVYTEDALWGRYWGSTEYLPGLHFEACYYQAIEFCIERGIARFEGGAQGVHKLARGLLPVATRSLHAIADHDFAEAVADFCDRERVDVAHTLDELEASSPFRAAP